MEKPFLRLVAEDIHTRFGDDLSDVAIVFNNKRPIAYLKKQLAAVYGKAIWSPQFFTIQEFFSQSSSLAQASSLSQFFYLFQLHNELLKAEGAEAETLEEFYPIAEIILSDFGQLDYELVDVDQVFMELYDTTKIDIAFQHFTEEQQAYIRQFWQSFSIMGHSGVQQRFLKLWRRMPSLYRALKARLKSEKQTNYPSLYRDLVDGLSERPNFVDKYKQVLFVGFNALNKAETALFQRWQAQEKALFYFDADAYYLEDIEQEAGLFIRRNLFGSKLQNALGEAANVLGNRDLAVDIFAAAGKVSQTKLLHDLLHKQYDPSKSAAILLADEALLVPLLQSLPNLTANITTGYPLMQSPLFGLIDLWLDVQEEVSHMKKKKVPFSYLASFINHPLTQVTMAEREKIFGDWSDKQLFEIPIEDIQVESTALPYFFKALPSPAMLIPALIQMIDKLLTAISSEDRLSQIESTLLVESKKVLNQLLLGLEKIDATSISFQIGLIRKVIAPVNSAIEGDPLNGLQIMGLLESRCLNFDQVYLLGANDGVLPKTSNSPTFLPNNLRKAYGLPVLENQDALSAYLFYRHFQYSSDIHIFYNSLVDQNSTGEVSRFVKQLMFESKFHFKQYNQQQTISFQEPNAELIIPKEGEVWDKLWNSFIQQKRKLSATALTTYLQSPLQFFLKHVAEIKEPPTVSQEFEMNKLGTVVHNVMETIFLPFKGNSEWISVKKLADRLPDVEQLVVLEIARQYQGTQSSLADLNSMEMIMHKIACEYVKMYLQYDVDSYKAFRVIELENDQDYVLDFPIQIQGQEEHVRLFGIIDRVDEVLTHDAEVITRIVDYKTGGDSVKFKDLEKVFSSNSDNKALVQTLFYAYVYEQVSGRMGLEPHLYVARKMREEGTVFNGRTQVLVGEELQEAKEEFVSFLRTTLEEIFDASIPFKHYPDALVYPSDPYTLFYRNALAEDSEEEASE